MKFLKLRDASQTFFDFESNYYFSSYVSVKVEKLTSAILLAIKNGILVEVTEAQHNDLVTQFTLDNSPATLNASSGVTSQDIERNAKQIDHRVLIVQDFYTGIGTPTGFGVFIFSDLTNPLVVAVTPKTVLSFLSKVNGQVSIEVLPTGNTFLRAEVEGNVIAHKVRGLMTLNASGWDSFNGGTYYTVSFAGVGVTTASKSVADGGMVSSPVDPTRTDYIFTGWLKSDGSVFDFDTDTVTEDITLTAKFVDAIGGTVTGASIALNAAKTGYEFSYTYANSEVGATGATPIVTWATSDQADGAGATEVSTATTYLPTGVNRYKYLVGTLVVEGSNKQKTTAQTLVIYPGFSTEITIPAGGTRFTVRERHTALSFDGKLWVIGGFDGGNKNDVWSSEDGATWTQLTANAGFTARRFHTSVVHNNKMWVIGGFDGRRKNDVWSSEDGATWTQVTAGAQFSARTAHTSVVHNNKIWVIGGYDGSNKNDIWSSTDGITWTQVTAGAQFSVRSAHTSVASNGKIWVIGGNSGGSKNDVWSSEDGATWTQLTADAQFSGRQEHTSAAFDGKIWVIAGNSGGNKNDVWSSEDGATWTQVTTGGFSARKRSTVVVKDNKVFVIAGDDGSVKNDVWY